MFYYLVDIIGSGTKKDPFRPDMPDYVRERGFATDEFSETQVVLKTDYEVPELAGKQISGDN